MPFHLMKEGKTSLWAEVYDSDLRIGIGHTTRDMPKNPAQARVMVRRDNRFLFFFDVTYSLERDSGFTAVYAGQRADVVRGYLKHKSLFPEFPSEDEFVSYVRAGAELMFTPEVGALGRRYVCRLN